MEGHHHHQNPHHHLHHQQQQQQQQFHLQQQQQQQQQHHPHQQQLQQNNPNISVSVDVTDRFPQWSLQETKELLIIRAEFDQTFMETKRNKLLWEVISTRMKEKGFNRSPEQCKCKWKNLVTRYKGCETMEAEVVRQQFPFYNEVQAIFAARTQMRMLWSDPEGAGMSGFSKKKGAMSSDDEEDIHNINDIDVISEGEQKGNIVSSSGINMRKKKKLMKSSSNNVGGTSGGIGSNNLREILEDFMKQQMAVETQWREAFEAREEERRLKEMEWRQTMEALESERLLMERRWREREEQRRIREEARAEKRDALITALLNKLRREDL
ncbi:trihelix transcription factor GT-3b-like [Humulus lupulus]|uniref:trihelix transcription factor GT-3b-like n=1 Tax=Humulus lupulus TaxID=3486 RepID=UPI002B408E13|nr:trihelix transcription factor GT-3b-like [Humulus lupulus]